MTKVLHFPVPPGAEVLPSTPVMRAGVHIEPVVGYNAVSLTYMDEEGIPRIRVMLDHTVPNVDWWQRMIERMGRDLGPFAAPRRLPVLGDRRSLP